jgi:hypothetical protein
MVLVPTRQAASTQRPLLRSPRPCRHATRASVGFTLRGGDDLGAGSLRLAGSG